MNNLVINPGTVSLKKHQYQRFQVRINSILDRAHFYVLRLYHINVMTAD